MIGYFALLGLQFDLAALASVLMVAGYSTNDTVIVFDRIRENRRKYKKMSMKELAEPLRQSDTVADAHDIPDHVAGAYRPVYLRRRGHSGLSSRR